MTRVPTARESLRQPAPSQRLVLKKPNTNVELTREGRRRVTEHWQQLERLKTLAERSPEKERRSEFSLVRLRRR